MDHCFKENQEVSGLFFPDTSQLDTKQSNVDKITVVMEYGQMAAVPWFAVWKDGKIISKHNGAHLSSVTFEGGMR